MDDKELIKSIIKKIIDKTFDVIREIYENQKESNGQGHDLTMTNSSLIIFPKYRDETDRISDQELRFIFVEQFYEYKKEVEEAKEYWPNLYYSVEVPTKNTYIFSKKKDGPKVVEGTDEKGVSARTDLVIYKKKDSQFIREALIEFKALNPANENYQKDFCKLENENEDNALKYFIQIIKNCDKSTIDSLKGKIASKTPDTIYRCCCLEGGKKEITKEIIE